MLCSRSARDGEDELAQVLGLALVFGAERQPRQLGDAFDELGHFLAEDSGNLLARGLGVLDDVVQQGGHDGGRVHPVFGEDAGDLDRMSEVGVAGRAFLRSVHPGAVHVGAVEQGLVRGGIVGFDALDQLVLAQEPARRLGRSFCGIGGLGGGRCRDGRRGRLGWLGLGAVQAQ